jgi:HD-GYP domain-containing protein (c-di-GMP phosphodiesterase class II)
VGGPVHEYIPSGLKGPDILIQARIIAVADGVEAMSSHRPYRPALGVLAALEEISEKRGALYDANVVQACVELFEKKRFRFSEWQRASSLGGRANNEIQGGKRV